ncbi:MAG TPA: BTAD domain-containing putative transcriptional regulator, partial [Gemmatimonadaceae bacterium]
MHLRLRTFGNVYLSRDEQVLSGVAAQRRLLAILTVLSTVAERGITRDKLLALLWSEGEPERSRHALTQSLYHIRKALGAEKIFLSGGDLRINPEVLSSDVGDFQRAVRESRFEEAAGLYAGPFLDGFYLNGDPEFDFWVSSERDRLAREFAEALRCLAEAAQATGDPAAELKWRTRLADHDPLNGGAIAGLMSAMIATGDHASALQRARGYESRIRAELDLPPDRAVTDLLASLPRPAATPQIEAEEPATPVAESVNTDDARAFANAPHVVEFVPPAAPARARSRQRRGLFIGAAAAILATAVATRVAASHIASDRDAARRATIAVAPFHVEASNATAAYLREGLLDLLSTRIADADRKRAADPTSVLRAWRNAHLEDDSMPSPAVAASIARDLDAGEVVVGSLRTTDSGVAIHASLIDALTGHVRANVDATGSADSLIALTDRIISGLILPEAGDHLASLPHPPTVSPTALRAYLNGRAAYRHADYSGAVQAYNRAIVLDPNFALAALGLAMSADRVNAAEQHDRGLAIAWAKQDQLPEADRAYLRAFAGPRYPSPSSAGDALAAWERVVRVAPDRAEGWYELGESFYYDGDLLGMHDALPRSEQALRRALRLDPTFTPAARMLAVLLARRGDTVALRQVVGAATQEDTADAMTVFVRWRAAQALKDSRELARVRRSFDDAPNGALRMIAMTAQFDGVSVVDGDRALAILGRRALTDAELVDVALARHSRALNGGNYKEALEITSELARYQPALHPQLRLRVLDALYSRGDESAA